MEGDRMESELEHDNDECSIKIGVNRDIIEKYSAFQQILNETIINAMKKGKFQMSILYDPELQNVEIKVEEG